MAVLVSEFSEMEETLLSSISVRVGERNKISTVMIVSESGSVS